MPHATSGPHATTAQPRPRQPGGPARAGEAGSGPRAGGDDGASALTGWAPGRRWRYALKLHGWPKVLVAWLLGVGWALGLGVAPGWGIALGAVEAVLLLVAIVLLNDWADAPVDRIKRRMFPGGCSPKTIPDGILPAGSLAFWGFVALALFVALGWIAAPLAGAPSGPALETGIWTTAAALVFVAYSLPPLRLNYRGGGELLEALGVGLVMPAFSAHLAGAGSLLDPARPWPFWVLPGLLGAVSLALASALASGLSDEQSDRAGGKRTVASVRGNRAARRWISFCLPAGLVCWALGGAALLLGGRPAAGLPLLAAALVAAWPAVRAMWLLPAAVTNAFRAQGQHKLWLHRSIWWGTAVLAVGWIVAGRWFGLPDGGGVLER